MLCQYMHGCQCESAELRLKEEQKLRKAHCQTARQTLAEIKSARYLFEIEENGERRVISDDARMTAEQEAVMQVKRWCN